MENELMQLGHEAIRQFGHRSLLEGWIASAGALVMLAITWRCLLWAKGQEPDEEIWQVARILFCVFTPIATIMLAVIAIDAFLDAAHPVSSLITSIGG